MKTLDQSAKGYFEEAFEGFDGYGQAQYSRIAQIKDWHDNDAWDAFWKELKEIERKALLIDIDQAGKE